MKNWFRTSKSIHKCGFTLILVVCILAASTIASAEVSSGNYYGTGNPDAYAWLEIPELGVSCPVLQNETDDMYYVNHDAQGNKSDMGALFSQATFNGKDFTDTMTTIYGSSLSENELFGGLQGFYTDDKNFFELGYREINIHVDDHIETWVVFAALPYSPTHMEYYYDFENARVYKSFFDYLAAMRDIEANLDTELFPDPGEQILCLSTSLKEDGTRAYTVFARRLEAVQNSERKSDGVQRAKEQWNFTPSATGKLMPSIKSMVMDDGTVIENVFSAGDELKDEINDYLVITPVAKRDEAPLDEITERLNTAYADIQEKEGIRELHADGDNAYISYDLEKILEDLNTKISVDNLVVRDLFDITPFGMYKAYMGNDEKYIDITFDLHVNPDETVITMESQDGETWTVIPADMVTLNEDGSYTVRLYDLHVLAFVVEAKMAEEIDTSSADAVLSPIVKR